ncbi:efflux RND transporter periplasmic adaptor subunit [Sansalvadorimonas verongulae]|uniref:efflux RND transporter periplasmic adaptor subunit n=1 Tax=Sansalvadorimonas verongulae TaxID=2172824 RepID=UPI0012BC9CEB|nr:efflux RND transporter periplasmic adaptor subunit [Sansalvadorimonas verongulae]MTI13488.1 efflux RND transporter periplasmic adaptor subunit [Sansalvadorimonas verongulae]
MRNCFKQTPFAFLAITVISLSILTTSANASGQRKPPSPTVTAAIVENTLVSQDIPALGTLKANQAVSVVSQVSGRVSSLNIEDGLFVNEGDVLVSLDNREQSARVKEAKVTLSDAVRQLNNSTNLYNTKAISKDQLQAQQAVVDKARAVLAREEAALSYLTLTAPFSGVLGFSDTSTGALLSANQSITTLDDLSVMKLFFDLPENSLSRVAPGTKIIAVTDAWPDEIFTGTIDTINPRINPNNLTYTARAVLDNANGQLRPGMMVRISVQQKAQNTLSVPARSIMFDGNKKYVYVIDADSVVHKNFITTGESFEESISVLDGLKPGDRIVDEGVVKARDGISVNVIDANVASNAREGGENHS